jgi:membrane protein required for colicin V production
MLTKMADFAALGLVNKIFGGVFALLKSVVILSVIFVFFNRINNTIPFVGKETLNNSLLYEPVRDIVPSIFPSIINKFDSEASDSEEEEE